MMAVQVCSPQERGSRESFATSVGLLLGGVSCDIEHTCSDEILSPGVPIVGDFGAPVGTFRSPTPPTIAPEGWRRGLDFGCPDGDFGAPVGTLRKLSLPGTTQRSESRRCEASPCHSTTRHARRRACPTAHRRSTCRGNRGREERPSSATTTNKLRRAPSRLQPSAQSRDFRDAPEMGASFEMPQRWRL